MLTFFTPIFKKKMNLFLFFLSSYKILRFFRKTIQVEFFVKYHLESHWMSIFRYLDISHLITHPMTPATKQ